MGYSTACDERAPVVPRAWNRRSLRQRCLRGVAQRVLPRERALDALARLLLRELRVHRLDEHRELVTRILARAEQRRDRCAARGD